MFNVKLSFEQFLTITKGETDVILNAEEIIILQEYLKSTDVQELIRPKPTRIENLL